MGASRRRRGSHGRGRRRHHAVERCLVVLGVAPLAIGLVVGSRRSSSSRPRPSARWDRSPWSRPIRPLQRTMKRRTRVARGLEENRAEPVHRRHAEGAAQLGRLTARLSASSVILSACGLRIAHADYLAALIFRRRPTISRVSLASHRDGDCPARRSPCAVHARRVGAARRSRLARSRMPCCPARSCATSLP